MTKSEKNYTNLYNKSISDLGIQEYPGEGEEVKHRERWNEINGKKNKKKQRQTLTGCEIKGSVSVCLIAVAITAKTSVCLEEKEDRIDQ